MNAKAITAYLGHASVQTTFDLYGHLMPGNEDEAVALVDAYLERADTGRRRQNSRVPLTEEGTILSLSWRSSSRGRSAKATSTQ